MDVHEMIIIQRGPCKRHNATASPIAVEGVLLHTTEGGGKSYLDELFIENVRQDGGGKTTTVSVHFAVYKDGEVRAYAPWRPNEAWYCYHAGQSRMPDGRPSASRHLLGIEIQHMSGELFTDAQMDSLYELLGAIAEAWKGQPSWKGLLLRHREVAPERKTDPTRPFDQQEWPTLRAWWDGQQTGEEDDMTDKDRALLEELVTLGKQARVSDVARSHQDKILEALIAGEPPERIAALKAQKAEAVRAERKRLGL